MLTISSSRKLGFAALSLALVSGAATAATIGGNAVDATLTFSDPTETVGSTDTIPWM